MSRESRILLVTGFLLLFTTIGWTLGSPPAGVPPAVSAFLLRSDRLGSGPPFVGIVFSPEDCGSLIQQLRLWNEPYLQRVARVRGLLRYEGDDLRPKWKVVHGAGLVFPVQRASVETLARVQPALGYAHTSLVVVFDSTGRVREAVPLAELADVRARAELLRLVHGFGGRTVGDRSGRK